MFENSRGRDAAPGQLRRLSDAAVLAAYVGPDLIYQFVNDAYSVWFGVDPKQIVGRSMDYVLGEEGLARVRTYVEIALAGGTAVFETDLSPEAGPPRRVKATYAGRLAPDGSPLGFFVLAEDLTEKRRAEEIVTAVLDGMADAFLAVDPQWRVTEFNASAERTYEIERDKMLGRDIRTVFPQFEASEGGRLVREVLTSRKARRQEVQSIAKQGVTFVMDAVPLVLGGVGIVLQDVTAQRRAEAELDEGRERLRLATHAAGVGIWEWRLQTNEMIYSPEAKVICGFPLDAEVTHQMVLSVTHRDDLPHTSAQARRALDPAIQDQSPYEYRICRPDGEERWVLAVGRAVFDEIEGQTVATRYIGTIQDITARKQAEIEAADTAARLRLAIDAARLAVWRADEKGVTPSPELNRLLGFPDDATPTLEEYSAGYLPGERERVRAAAGEAMARGQMHFEVEYQYRRRDDGGVVWLAMRAQILPGQKEAIGVLLDVTDRKR